MGFSIYFYFTIFFLLYYIHEIIDIKVNIKTVLLNKNVFSCKINFFN